MQYTVREDPRASEWQNPLTISECSPQLLVRHTSTCPEATISQHAQHVAQHEKEHHAHNGQDDTYGLEHAYEHLKQVVERIVERHGGADLGDLDGFTG